MITAQQLALQTVGMNPFYRVSAYPEAFPPSDRVNSFLRAALHWKALASAAAERSCRAY